jgi:hypothetical protein
MRTFSSAAASSSTASAAHEHSARPVLQRPKRLNDGPPGGRGSGDARAASIGSTENGPARRCAQSDRRHSDAVWGAAALERFDISAEEYKVYVAAREGIEKIVAKMQR